MVEIQTINKQKNAVEKQLKSVLENTYEDERQLRLLNESPQKVIREVEYNDC